jgi:hypothetical protein
MLIRQYRAMPDVQPRSLVRLFEPLPLPRWRAYLSLTFGALALLLVGGVLSYASGSPDVHGSVSTYWTVLFTYHAVAFGGAALLGAFPRLARLPIKIAWLVALLCALIGATLIRAMAMREVGMTTTLPDAIVPYAAAVLPVVFGLWWRGA